MIIDINGIKTYYEISGEGEVILLLHGWGGNCQTMHPISNILKDKYKCIIVDLPGFGETSQPEYPWNSNDYAIFIQNFLEKLDISTVNLIGHSHGGRISIILSAKKYIKVQKIMLIDSAGLIPIRTIKYHLKVKTYKIIKKIFPSIVNGSRNNSFFMKIFGSKDYQDTTSELMKKTMVKVVNDNLQDLLPKIEAETLLVWGESDQDTPLYMAKEMESKIPNAGLVILKDAGHYSYIDDYNTFKRVAESYFKMGE